MARRAVALAVLRTVFLFHGIYEREKSSKLAELRKADRPSPLMRRARAGQPHSGGAAVSDKKSSSGAQHRE